MAFWLASWLNMLQQHHHTDLSLNLFSLLSNLVSWWTRSCSSRDRILGEFLHLSWTQQGRELGHGSVFVQHLARYSANLMFEDWWVDLLILCLTTKLWTIQRSLDMSCMIEFSIVNKCLATVQLLHHHQLHHHQYFTWKDLILNYYTTITKNSTTHFLATDMPR